MTQHTTIDCLAADVTVLPVRHGSRLSKLWSRLRRLYIALKHRLEARRLATFDDRMLNDIGLDRADVDHALNAPFSADPTEILAGRARQRRMANRHKLRSVL